MAEAHCCMAQVNANKLALFMVAVNGISQAMPVPEN